MENAAIADPWPMTSAEFGMSPDEHMIEMSAESREFEELRRRPVNDPGATQDNRKGLTKQRIDRFQHFVLQISAVGHKCDVCQFEPAIGTPMVRLDCHVDHVFCESCAVGWFEGHNTCPKCRHAFS